MPTAPTLNLTYVRSADNTYITVTDLTGAYSASNTGGYGFPNVDTSMFTAFNISVTLPDPDTLLPSGTPVVVDAYSTFPSSADGTFILTSLALLGTADTTLIDGVYLFEVSAPWVDGLNSGTVTASNNKAYYSIVQCCINNMIVDSINCNCNGASKKVQTLNLAAINLLALSPQVVNDVITPSPIEQCGQWDVAATSIIALQDICNNENCGGCNGCR